MEHNANKICKTVISGKKQILNNKWLNFRISIPFQYFMYILAKFNTFSRSWKPISQFSAFHTCVHELSHLQSHANNCLLIYWLYSQTNTQ